jgi:hypothetical protein
VAGPLYVDDRIASGQKIGRLMQAHSGDIIWDVAARHVSALLDEAGCLREDFDIAGAAVAASDPEDPKST